MAEKQLERLSNPESNPFIDGPFDLLCFNIAEEIRNDETFKLVFNKDSVNDYMREDYQIRQLPALRVYNEGLRKEHESHYVTGELLLDVIFPPSIRRRELQLLPDRISSALMQQFRRPNFFARMCEKVPGLNELGKTFEINKALAMQVDDSPDNPCPVVQIKANLRLDLKEWDDYLEREGRTKEDPFKVTLKELRRVVTEIEGWRTTEPESLEVEIGIDQKIQTEE